MPRPTTALLAAALLLPLGSAAAHPMGHEDATPPAGSAVAVDPDMHVGFARVHGVEHAVSITEKDGYRVITSNSIPDHEPGEFPTRGNPNTISPQDYTFRMPLNPEKAAGDFRGRVLFGVALNGVPFDPGTAEIWSPTGRVRGPDAPRDGWRYEALTGNIDLGLDDHNAHVQPTGAYHYHALPVGVYEKAAGQSASEVPDQMVLIGYAADGFPIYGVYAHQDPHDPASPLVQPASSYRIKDGNRPPESATSPGGEHDGTFVQDWEYVQDLGNLDEHHGQHGVTPEYPDGTYYYLITAEYPFIPRSLYGTPDRSFAPKRTGLGPGTEGGEQAERPRRERGERRGADGDRPRRPPPF